MYRKIFGVTQLYKMQVCQSPRCFMATSSKIPLIICLRIFSTSTTPARSLFMNWSTNCLSRGNRWMNLNTAFSPLHSKPQREESRHRMSAPAQAVHHQICLGTIRTRISFKDRNPKADDDNNPYDLHLPFFNDAATPDRLRLYSQQL